MEIESYFQAAHTPVISRNPVWIEIVRYLNRFFPASTEAVLDLGAGYCSFINNVNARRRIAVDLGPVVRTAAATGVEVYQSRASNLSFIADSSIDVVFASNLLEHLEFSEVEATLKEISRVLRSGGVFIALQPNFYCAYRDYFHDYTHRTIFTHVSLADIVSVHGLRPKGVIAKILPGSFQKKYGGIDLPKLPEWILKLLVRAYLWSPIKPLAKQMLVVGEKYER